MLKGKIFTFLSSLFIVCCALGGCYWWIKPKNIEEELNWKRFSLLDVEGTSNNKEWETLAGKYLKDKDTKLEITLSDKSNFQEIKNGCAKILKKPIEEKERYFETAKDWCTEESKYLKS